MTPNAFNLISVPMPRQAPQHKLTGAPLTMRLGFDMVFDLPAPTPMVLMLYVHPEKIHHLRSPEMLRFEPHLVPEIFYDTFGNRCARVVAPAGELRVMQDQLYDDLPVPEPQPSPEARQHPIEELPAAALQYLLGSRYCEIDRLSAVAWDLFGKIPTGGARVLAINEWVFKNITFGYRLSRPNKMALDVYTERTGVCRDMMHLAVTFCRALNIPARYATGYLGDIEAAPDPTPMDFSAFYEVYLDGQWWPMDARHNVARIGRVLMARGRDAADVALVTSFGAHKLKKFTVVTDEYIEPKPQLALSA